MELQPPWNPIKVTSPDLDRNICNCTLLWPRLFKYKGLYKRWGVGVLQRAAGWSTFYCLGHALRQEQLEPLFRDSSAIFVPLTSSVISNVNLVGENSYDTDMVANSRDIVKFCENVLVLRFDVHESLEFQCSPSWHKCLISKNLPTQKSPLKYQPYNTVIFWLNLFVVKHWWKR